ncbi:unnamed protein product, partial [Arctogadus glacialis]
MTLGPLADDFLSQRFKKRKKSAERKKSLRERRPRRTDSGKEQSADVLKIPRYEFGQRFANDNTVSAEQPEQRCREATHCDHIMFNPLFSMGAPLTTHLQPIPRCGCVCVCVFV